MTITETTSTTRLRPVVFDIYRDIHKGIRSELFAVVEQSGRLDPADSYGAAALVDQIKRAVQLLVDHAEHEDRVVQPALELHAPGLADRIASDHHDLDTRMDRLASLAGEMQTATPRRPLVHELYVELAAFTGAYLLHQDVEEREVSQALEAAVGVDGVVGIHMDIIQNMPPQQLIGGLSVMFPAMNIDDRTELLGGMKATAPAAAFAGVWSLAKSVLSLDDSRAVAVRLGLD